MLSCKKLKRFLIFYGLFTFLCVPSGFMAGLFVNRVYGEAYWYLTAVEAAGFAGMLTGSIFMSIRGSLAEQKMLYCGLFLFGIIGAGDGDGRKFSALSCSDDRIRSGNDSCTDTSDGNCPETEQRRYAGKGSRTLELHVLWRHAPWDGGLRVCSRLVPYAGDYGWGGNCSHMLRSGADTGMKEMLKQRLSKLQE